MKRLSLTRVSEMELEPANGASGLPRIDERTNLKDALSEMIGAGVERGLVVSDQDGVRGTISIQKIKNLSHRAEAGRHGV
ncbi:hypothetical protein BH24ACT19_BH24ACT19_21110 [soil metagenome]